MNAHARGEPLSIADLPYRQQRALVAARHGCRPTAVDRWPADELADALSVLGVAT